MSLTHVDPHVSEIVMVWIQSGDLLMVWIQISLKNMRKSVDREHVWLYPMVPMVECSVLPSSGDSFLRKLPLADSNG
jgi:hypothetical protein